MNKEDIQYLSELEQAQLIKFYPELGFENEDNEEDEDES